MQSVIGRADIGELWHGALSRRCVTFRYYGPNNSRRRPMFHRFEVKGGVTLIEAFADNIVKHNVLYRRLVRNDR